MKTFKSFAYLMAIAIVGVAVSSCKDNKEVENTGYNPDRETVKSQFAINLSGNVVGNNGQKKMQATQVNLAGNLDQFNGIDNLQIIPYTKSVAPTPGSAPVSDGMAANSNIIFLSAIPSNTDYSNGNLTKKDINNNVHSKIYSDVLLPVGTNGLLFYGKAIGSAASTDFAYETTDANRHIYGALKTQAALKQNPFTLANVTFEPLQINPTITYAEAGSAGEKILQYLNGVAGATAATADNQGKTKWSETSELRLSELYNQFTKGTADAGGNGLQAGSSASVKAMMVKLYSKVVEVETSLHSSTISGSDNQYDALITAIKNAINDNTYVANAENGTGSFAWKTDLNNYPMSLTNPMPDGSAAIYWDGTEFKAKGNQVFGTDPTTQDVAVWSSFVYPASLYYFGNSTIKASDNPGVAKGFTNTTSTYSTSSWQTEMDKASNYNDNFVKTTTRSIAMYSPINYAVGRLDLAVRAQGTAVATAETGVNVDFSKITLTGVLISGINDVKWDFTPNSAKTYIYYDNDIANPTVNINNDASWTISNTDEGRKWNNHTLVLESTAGKAINLCLEFLNNDQDFKGVNGQVIPKGTKFYLIGKLDPSTLDATKKHDANDANKVFLQDHYTIARITIGDMNNKAYNVIPDLKVPELEFALSVDLEWQQGMEFDLTW